jgi:hypothetical protein
VNDFVRAKIREDGFFRQLMPPVMISNDELDQQVQTDQPVIVDKKSDKELVLELVALALKHSHNERIRSLAQRAQAIWEQR